MKKRVKRPNIFVYSLFFLICKVLATFKFKLKVIRNELKKKKGPCVIIANHEASIDFINLTAAVKRRINYVISNSFYQTLGIKSLLNACGVIPKQQFQTAITDLKKMKEVVQNNGTLTIYPAGLMTENGVSTIIPGSSGKLLKFLKEDVYVAYTTGSYLTHPKWSKVYRKGRITLDVYLLATKEEINQMSIEELDALVIDRLSFNEYENQETAQIEYKNGDNVEGFENVLHLCPKCQKEFVMTASGNTFKCSSCGNQARSDKFGFLTKVKDGDIVFKHPNKWYDYIYELLKNEITQTENYTLSSHGKLQMIEGKKQKFVEVGEIDLTLNSKEFTLNGQVHNQPFNLVVSIAKSPMLPFSPGKSLEIQDGPTIYRFIPEDGKIVIKWIMALKIFAAKQSA